MRNMSFALTIKQFKNKTKTVTRRYGWAFLKPGDKVMGVEKAMGLKSGETIKKLGAIEITSIRKEPLNAVTQQECIKEGFPDLTPDEFTDMICRHYRSNPDTLLNRIEFKYL